jgi:hypothetical protein
MPAQRDPTGAPERDVMTRLTDVERGLEMAGERLEHLMANRGLWSQAMTHIDDVITTVLADDDNEFNAWSREALATIGRGAREAAVQLSRPLEVPTIGEGK